MNNRFFELSKKGLMVLSLAVACGGFSACSDDYDLDEKGNNPAWLGSSIYESLQNPNQDQLSGTFTNFLRLVDDLGLKETLSKTGSVTLFPANDEAFARFFANNTWNVTKYEDLSATQKSLLLNSAMLENAILTEMLSNVSNGATDVTRGEALKHQTRMQVVDTVTHIYSANGMPANNRYWTKHFQNGIDVVTDGTRPMMVHFTAEQMTAKSITTTGDNSDFSVLTGTPYDEATNPTYIFRDRIINPNVTCKNGYIHQLEDVLVPPGNIAQLLRDGISGSGNTTKLFSRMLDYYSVPIYNSAITNNYNDAALAVGKDVKDSIFEWRYFSAASQGNTALNLYQGNTISNLLNFDPGWNQYPASLADLGCIFVPSDAALKEYFLNGGSGAFLLDLFGSKPNTEENLDENLDSLFSKRPEIITAFMNNLMKSSFTGNVPSKFGNVMNDASDPMGISLGDLALDNAGKYDIRIANNGVAYVTNKVFAPVRYNAVSAPALLASDMNVMNRAIQDGYNNQKPLGLNMNFYAYLLAMSANYALFLPTDRAFDNYYIDPTTVGTEKYLTEPRALHFYYDASRAPYVFCSQWKYDPATNTVTDSLGRYALSKYQDLLIDILNTHTIVLKSGESLGSNGNKYYKTKNGGEIYVPGASIGNAVYSGAQLDNGLEKSTITQIDNMQNGNAYTIDHPIQMPQQSVYKILNGNSQFTDFMALCMKRLSVSSSSTSDLLEDIGISGKINDYGSNEQAAFEPFYNIAHLGKTDRSKWSLGVGYDYNVRYFNTYNYTVYAPDNNAMQLAKSKGLPTWDDVMAIYDAQDIHNKVSDARNEFGDDYEAHLDDATRKTIAKLYAMVDEIDHFIRYHFQDNSVYVDNVIDGGEYSTAAADTLGIHARVTVSGSGNTMIVKDNRNNQVTITNGGKMVNKMAREYLFKMASGNITGISSSSFAVIHEIDTPLNYHLDTDRFDAAWTTPSGQRNLVYKYHKFLTNLRKQRK